MKDKNHSTINWPGALVSTHWLAENLGVKKIKSMDTSKAPVFTQPPQPKTKVVDATYFLPNENKDSQIEFQKEHIPGAVHFNIDTIANRDLPYDHMLPDKKTFEKGVGALGIQNDDYVVVYDSRGIFSAPRVWWTFRVYGHTSVGVLDGGLPKWKGDGYPVETGVATPLPTTYHAQPGIEDPVCSKADILNALGSPDLQILDARAKDRFYAKVDEPREGVESGHIPGSINLPFSSLMSSQDGTFLPTAQLRSVYEKAGVDLGQPAITLCGSGVTAATLCFGLHLLGQDRYKVYDASWAEWGKAPDTPIAKE